MSFCTRLSPSLISVCKHFLDYQGSFNLPPLSEPNTARGIGTFVFICDHSFESHCKVLLKIQEIKWFPIDFFCCLLFPHSSFFAAVVSRGSQNGCAGLLLQLPGQGWSPAQPIPRATADCSWTLSACEADEAAVHTNAPPGLCFIIGRHAQLTRKGARPGGVGGKGLRTAFRWGGAALATLIYK